LPAKGMRSTPTMERVASILVARPHAAPASVAVVLVPGHADARVTAPRSPLNSPEQLRTSDACKLGLPTRSLLSMRALRSAAHLMHRPQRLLLAFCLIVTVVSTACASLPRPVPADVPTAQAHYPTATLQSLQAGRQAFVESCSGCHALPHPEKKRPNEWPQIVDEMAIEAKLNVAESELIAQFLVTMSERAVARQIRR
jgi:cytochrome c5